ncbi:hypothetical protein [Vreelandella aquamarina]|uniref:hypothetical protein n=1 Tax=Vreelandella aquamarina TaxID=77097 RepID=UPI001D1845DF|nr:hypothetical protein [Halomonas meridiana]MCC4288865.1 hypothetical protein [Halomonas meridiana]
MNLILHIGHGKTGSSALQSFLALNSDILKKYNIDYPPHASFQNAKKGFISSGNLPLVDNFWDEYINKKALSSTADSLLFSNESLIHKILSHPEKIEALNEKYKLILVMYVRNPLDHIFSSYGQQVKRHGQTLSMSEWVDNYQVLDKVSEVIRVSEKYNINLQLINYSTIDKIEESFFSSVFPNQYINFFAEAKLPETKTINRSLSRVEYEIQREFNRHLGSKSAAFVSDYLVNNAPDVKSEKEYIEESVLQGFIAKNEDKVKFINTYLDDNNQLSIEKPADIKPYNDTFEISSKQISVLAEGISKQINRTSNARLENNDADSLRDIALKFENKKPITIEDAYYLMSLAHKARPEGPIINKKLQDFESLVKVKSSVK